MAIIITPEIRGQECNENITYNYLVTSHNRFINRSEAYCIAKEQEQLLYPDRSKIMTVDEETRLFGLDSQSDKSIDILISEDLFFGND